jgi:uncharacterized protein
MNLTIIDQIARDQMLSRREHTSREPGWLYFHGLRVAKTTIWLSEQLQANVDRDIIHVASLFHDVGKGNSPHGDIGAAMTWQLLGPHCTTEELDAISDIIRKHCKRGNPQDTLATKIVQDADILDHAGMIGIWTSFYWSGSHGEVAEDHSRFVFGEENHRMRQVMRNQLNFEPSKLAFDERIAREDSFFLEFHRIYQEGV